MKVGIVGCGFVANYHVKAWKNVGTGVLAVADIIEDKAREFAHRHGIPYYFKSVEDMLSRVKLDVLSVCTPPQAHREAVLEAVKRGVSVFVEKGVVGELKRVDVVVYAPEDIILNPEGGWLKNLPEGVFGEVLPHPIYLLQSLIGKLDLISASTAKISKSTWQKYDELHCY